MTKKEFLNKLSNYYFISDDEITNKKTDILVEWVEEKEKELEIKDFQKLFNLIVESFTPTSINPFPTIAHINPFLKEINFKTGFFAAEGK